MGPGLRPRCAACRRSARSCAGACRKQKSPGKQKSPAKKKSPGMQKSSEKQKSPEEQKPTEKRKFTEVLGRCDVCLRSIDNCNGDCEKKIERKVEKKIRKKRESSPELELNRVIEEITKQRDMNLKTRDSEEQEAKVLEREEAGKKRNLVEVLGRSPSPRSSPSPTKGFFMKESTTCPSLSFLPCPISKQLSTTTTTTTCSHSTMESPVEDAPTPGGSWEVAPLPPGFNQELGKFLKMAKFEAFKASNRNFADMSNILG